MIFAPIPLDGAFSVACGRRISFQCCDPTGGGPERHVARTASHSCSKFPYLPELCDRKNDSSFLSDMGRYEQSSYLLALRQFVRVIPGAKGLVFLPLWKMARPSPWLPPMHRQMLLQLAGCLPGIYILNTLS